MEPKIKYSLIVTDEDTLEVIYQCNTALSEVISMAVGTAEKAVAKHKEEKEEEAHYEKLGDEEDTTEVEL